MSAQKEALRAIWREAAEKGIDHGIDWPRVVLDLFRDLDAAENARGDAARQALLDAADDPAMTGSWRPFGQWLKARAARMRTEARP